MFWKLVAFLTAFVLVLTVGVSALNGTENHWAGEYALTLYKMGIMSGDDQGNANLADNIKRSEFLALLIRAVYSIGDIHYEKSYFPDIPKTAWYYTIANFAKEKGIVEGDDNGMFLPDNNIKREEIVLMLVRALELKGTDTKFSDIDSSYAYYKEICAAASSGIIKGYEDNSFMPKNPATRGEAAAMIARLFIPEKSKPPHIDEGGEGTIGGVNLTWHHVTKAGITTSGERKDGLNVISPTWFRIRSFSGEKPADYEYKLSGDNNYYFQDIGNMEYMKEAKRHGYKVWALFKSNDFSARNNSGFLNDENARKSAISYVREMVVKYGLDGINMDFENMLVEDRDIYTQFVKEMSEMTKELGIVLSVDVTKYEPLGGTWSLCYDRKAIAEYADYVALMAYDQHSASSTVAGSVGDLDWTEKAILKTLEEVPSEKIILGIPFYTRLWQTKNGKVVKTSAIGMEIARQKVEEAGVTPVYDEKTGQNYATWTEDGIKFEIWLEDEVSIKSRIDLAKKYGLAGVASWSMVFADSSAWTTIKENLK
ncbi:MAG: putative sporulation-specific glycosylase YdhD [Firmicutes bacterium ADurb.Bin193]|nr:MAG: putative sporulation-specific glycosylase YdhD [Firmicutes bacterium ADurb.Bin193]